MSRIRWYGPTLVLLAVVLLVMITGPSVVQRIAWAQQDAKISLIKESLSENPALAQLSNAFRQVATVVEPSVVFIQVAKKAGALSQGPHGQGSDEDMRRWFFGPHSPFGGPQDRRNPRGGEDELGDGEPGPAPEAPGTPGSPGSPGAPGAPGAPGGPDNYNKYDVPAPYANGSGWVYDNAGHIITNNHVIEGADLITVRFNDESERTATLVGTDPKTDIAVLKVEGGNLHPATLAREAVQQGDIVCAFGSPFRFEFSMSQGIVSAKGRHLDILRDRQGYENFIQTDAAINPGNSGGPLTNIYGQVVGMNTAIASRTGSFNGLGFAIPVDMIEEVANQLVKSGKVSRGYLGVYIDDLTPKMGHTFGYKGKGVLVVQPIEGGPGAKAGIQRGDIITKVNDKPVETADQLRNVIARFSPGAKVQIQVFRQGKPQDLQMTIEEQPEQLVSAGAGGVTPENPAAAPEKESQILRKLGVEAATAFTKDLADKLSMKYTPGVIVKSVRAGSAADAAHLMPRSVITTVQDTHVKSVAELSTELGKYDLKQGVRITVLERGVERGVERYVERYVLLELPND